MCVSLKQKNKVQKNKACWKFPTGKPDHFLKTMSAEISDANVLTVSDSEPWGQGFPSTDCLEIHYQPRCFAVKGLASSNTVLMHGVL